MMAETPRKATASAPNKPDASKNTDSPTLSDNSTEPIKVEVAGESADLAPTTGDVPDPRTESDEFQEGDQAGFQGRHGFENVDGRQVNSVPFVDPKNIPADVTTGVQPDSSGNKLLAAAQAKAPNLTQAFVDLYKLTDQNLADIANGAVPPPPAIGPAHTSDLFLQPGGWTQVPPGMTPDGYENTRAERARR